MAKTRGTSRIGRRISPGVERPPSERGPPPSFVDRDLTYYRDGARWSFSAGGIALEGHDLNRVISESHDVGLFMGVAQGLNDYRKRISAVARHMDQYARFEAVVEALLGKILGKMKKVYDQKMTGLNWRMENGQLILNGINVRSFLALYRIRKTDKARRFLKGLKDKLSVLLENRGESPDYERIRETVEELHREIHEELQADEPSPRSARRLLRGPSRPS